MRHLEAFLDKQPPFERDAMQRPAQHGRVVSGTFGWESRAPRGCGSVNSDSDDVATAGADENGAAIGAGRRNDFS
jgi:hypothetical protein